MSVICHMKDGNNITLTAAVSVAPWPNDDAFVQIIGRSSDPAAIAALVPVDNLDVAEVQ